MVPWWERWKECDLKKRKKLRNMVCLQCAVRKWLWRTGAMFLFWFFGYWNFGKIWPADIKIKWIYTWNFFNSKFSPFLCRKMTKFCQKKITGSQAPQELGRWAGRWTMILMRNWSRVLKRSSPVPGQGGKGSLSRKSRFSACQGLWKIVGRSASCRFFPHVRVLRISTKFNLQIKG